MAGKFRIVDEALVLAVEVVWEMEGWCCYWAMFPGRLFRSRVWTVRFQQSRTLIQSKSTKVPGCFPRTEDQGVGHLQARFVGGR